MSNEVLYGKDLFGQPMVDEEASITSQRFIVPPFSVLDTKTGSWQSRKATWKALGIKKESSENTPERLGLL
jgi:hypothetical protein